MEKTCGKECCTNCKFFNAVGGKAAWKMNYYCTVDGTDRLLGVFDNYTGYATNTARIELEGRCCRHFKLKSDTIEQRYAQLEQVAWEMLHDFQDAQQCAFDGHTDIAIDRVRAACGLYPNKLEALGVSIDD